MASWWVERGTDSTVLTFKRFQKILEKDNQNQHFENPGTRQQTAEDPRGSSTVPSQNTDQIFWTTFWNLWSTLSLSSGVVYTFKIQVVGNCNLVSLYVVSSVRFKASTSVMTHEGGSEMKFSCLFGRKWRQIANTLDHRSAQWIKTHRAGSVCQYFGNWRKPGTTRWRGTRALRRSVSFFFLSLTSF